ncbi:MAG: hypothetical protein F4040_03805 [Synechococcus sp. SB0670_bin_20]|nr:hypothetical protein [Synechococcus sp. SB0670_bin_20]
MIRRFLLLSTGWGVGILMLLSLSLGAQNLERSSERLSLDLGFKTHIRAHENREVIVFRDLLL